MGPTTRSPMKLAAAAPWTGLKIAQHDKLPGGNYLEKHQSQGRLQIKVYPELYPHKALKG